MPAETQPADYADSPACQQSLMPFLKLLFARHKRHGGVTEIRTEAGPGQAGFSTFFGPGQEDAAVRLLQPAEGGAGGGKHPRIGAADFCYNPHPVDPNLHRRGPAAFTRHQPAGEADVVAYSQFAVRIEPVRAGDAPVVAVMLPGGRDPAGAAC